MTEMLADRCRCATGALTDGPSIGDPYAYAYGRLQIALIDAVMALDHSVTVLNRLLASANSAQSSLARQINEGADLVVLSAAEGRALLEVM